MLDHVRWSWRRRQSKFIPLLWVSFWTEIILNKTDYRFSKSFHMNVWYMMKCIILWSCTLWDFLRPTVLDQYIFFLRTEATKLDELCGSAHGVVWRRSAQGSHVDSWLKLQSHRPEWKGPEPRTGHHWGLCLLQTPFLCGLVLLEHRNTGDLQQFYFTSCRMYSLYTLWL